MSDESSLTVDNGNPTHIAIIMDGNGRWAQKRYLPRVAGHREGAKAVRKIIEYCVKEKIKFLTLFAFSSENWRRPQEEVSALMSLFVSTLETEINELNKNDIRFLCIGDKAAFPKKLQQTIVESEKKTENNQTLTLIIAANYGGRWDIKQAFEKIALKISSNELKTSDISEELISQYLSTAIIPEPDLFIRTGGEQRISNFLLWQLAYAELYFTPILWPDFDQVALKEAIKCFRGRQRRFGYTKEQILNNSY